LLTLQVGPPYYCTCFETQIEFRQRSLNRSFFFILNLDLKL
jgi:hypothetical protein